MASAAAEEHVPAANGIEKSGSRPSLSRLSWPYWLAVGVVVIGLLVTAGLVVVTKTLYDNNEQRLLDLRVREVASVLTGAQQNIQTPLASAAALANATGGDAHKFTRLVAPYVGVGARYQFVSLSLWALPTSGRPRVVVGERPAIEASSAMARAFLLRARRTPKFVVIGLTPPDLMRLGYAYTTPGPTGRFVIYGESQLPANRRSRLQSNSAFSELDYALYLGNNERTENLLVTSLNQLPVRGRRAKTTVPFGDTVLTLTVSAHQPLAGGLPERLPWIIAIIGVALTLGGGALTVRLTQGRRAAEHLAGRLEQAVGENQRLYAEQRTIAQTLQHALLPEELPQIPGADASARYEPGERGVEIGGDWYDVIPLGDQRLLLVVGDVSGHGLRAAATMASLRYAIHAYAAQGDSPTTILAKLSDVVSIDRSGHLATVLCALIDVGAHQIAVASAGHLPPLLISESRGEYVETTIGIPVGVQTGASYTSTTVAVPPGATFLAFTDGLVERRGENLDRGLERLRKAATQNRRELPELLSQLVTEMRSAPSEDDTAIVGLRWKD